jgi:cytochrome c5
MKLLGVFLILSAFLVSNQSCKATEKVSEDQGLMTADVGEGKVIYMRDCTRCHDQKTVEAYTKAQWSNILPRMIVKAQLNETESRQVTAYVEWEIEND